jgi:hypothetical protein
MPRELLALFDKEELKKYLTPEELAELDEPSESAGGAEAGRSN